MEFSLLDIFEKGWRFKYRGKKAHCFKDKISLCGKHTITDYEAGGLLPSGAIYSYEKCSKCKSKEIK